LPIERRLVRREGIVLNSVSYWSDVLTTWIGNPQAMIVRYDPRNLSRIYLLGPDGTYYDIPYRDLRRPAISWWEQRAAVERLRSEGRKAINESTIFSAVEAMRRITANASIDTKRLRRRRERERRLRVSAQAPARDAAPEFNGWELSGDCRFSTEEWT
jgi:putative transposase